MTLTLNHRAPRQIIAGDSIEFLVAIPPDYQTGWTGSARLTGPSAAMDATTCTIVGADFQLYFMGQGSSNATAQLPAGQYTLSVWALDGTGRRVTIAQFPISIIADLSSGTPAQQHALKMLPIIEAAIAARIGGNPDGGLEQYTIDGTAVTKVPIETLERLRNKYAAEVAAIQNPNGQIGRVKFVMTPTGQMVDARRRFN